MPVQQELLRASYLDSSISQETPVSQQQRVQTKVRRVIYQGLLDFDRRFVHLPREHKKLVPIQLIYPGEDFYKKQSTAV